MNPKNTPTFAENYCRLHRIPAERFERVVLARALYPHARLLAQLLRLIWPEHFAADLDLVRGAGQLRRVRDFSIEVAEYAYHPANHQGLRHVLRLRVSTQRLRNIVSETLHDSTLRDPPAREGTELPFIPSSEGRSQEIPKHP